jgi:hypothetical protein
MNIYTPTVAYLYKWTNLTTNKWYIGSRAKRGCHPDDGYICSSRTVKPMILENKEQWTRDILCLGTPEYIVDLETRLLTALDAKNDPMSYNQHNGDGKFTSAGVAPWNKGKGRPTGKPAWNRGLTKANNPSVAKMSASLQGRDAPNKGKAMSAKQRLTLTERHRNRTEETSKKISDALTGRKLTEEQKQKLSLAHKGKQQSPEHIAKRAQARRDFYAKKKAPEGAF